MSKQSVTCKNCQAEIPLDNNTMEIDHLGYVDLQFHCNECGKRTWVLIKHADFQEDV